MRINNRGATDGTECMIYIGYNDRKPNREHIEEFYLQESVVKKLDFKYFLSDNHFDHVKFHSRCKIVVFYFEKFSPKNVYPPTVFISWQGYHSGMNDKEKKDAFKDLMKLTCYLHTVHYLAVVIGGDFNISLDKVEDIIDDYGFVTQSYGLPKCRCTLIDFFVVTPLSFQKLTSSLPRSLPNRKAFIPGVVLKSMEAKAFSNDDPDGLIFDHVPVLATMAVPPKAPIQQKRVDISDGTLKSTRNT